ncbi:MAG: hypothetical protein A2X49_11135 [Lentisphaerae bacterium GWF2_52_8]|nr:MAG: hypothetical protein A2X49_11135 [Lentisphaerae bacterium GWF2_52_8]
MRIHLPHLHEIREARLRIAKAQKKKQDAEAALKKREISRICEDINERKFQVLTEAEKAEKAGASYRRSKILLSGFAVILASVFTINMTKELAEGIVQQFVTKKSPFKELPHSDENFDAAKKYLNLLFGRIANNESYKPGSAWRAEVPEAIAGEMEETLKHLYGHSFEVLSINANTREGYYYAYCRFPGQGNLSVNFKKELKGFVLSSLDFI